MDPIGRETNTQKTKKKFWVDYEPIEKMTLVMAIFTVIYSIITAGLLWLSSGQLDGMKKDERPWVRVRTQIQMPTDPSSTTITLPAHYINTGKTPAKSLSIEYYVEAVKNGEEPKLAKTNRAASTTTGILFSNEPSQPAPIPYTMLKSEFDDFKEQRTFVVIFGRADYTDIFGTAHWTDFCEFATVPGKLGAFTAQKCTNYSNTDDK